MGCATSKGPKEVEGRESTSQTPPGEIKVTDVEVSPDMRALRSENGQLKGDNEQLEADNYEPLSPRVAAVTREASAIKKRADEVGKAGKTAKEPSWEAHLWLAAQDSEDDSSLQKKVADLLLDRFLNKDALDGRRDILPNAVYATNCLCLQAEVHHWLHQESMRCHRQRQTRSPGIASTAHRHEQHVGRAKARRRAGEPPLP